LITGSVAFKGDQTGSTKDIEGA